MDNYPEEFTDLQKRPSDELAEIIADCCDKLFELFNTFADSPRKKAAVWPLQMMLLVLCPVSVSDLNQIDEVWRCILYSLRSESFVSMNLALVNCSQIEKLVVMMDKSRFFHKFT